MFRLLMSLVVSVFYESILSSNVICPSKEILVESFAELISDKGCKLVWKERRLMRQGCHPKHYQVLIWFTPSICGTRVERACLRGRMDIQV